MTAAADNVQSAWSAPVLISKQSSTTFSDKEQIWADNAASSPHFGNVYVCWASFRSNSRGNAFPVPLTVSRSSDGGVTWTTKQVGPATDNGLNSQPDGCTVRTDSKGNVYVFGIANRSGAEFETMYKSTDGGAHFGQLRVVAPAVSPGVFDAALGRPVMDGIAGARVDLAAGPSVDIANGAPTGADATDQIVLSWADGAAGLNHEHLLFTTSRDGGGTWTTPRAIESRGDRPVYTAPAISPNGTDVYVVYNAFTTPFRDNTTDARALTGVFLHADVTGGVPGAFSEVFRGPSGDPRGTSQNGLTAEFLGDYVYAAATRTYGTGVWNDASNARDLRRHPGLPLLGGDRRIRPGTQCPRGVSGELRQLRHPRPDGHRPHAIKPRHPTDDLRWAARPSHGPAAHGAGGRHLPPKQADSWAPRHNHPPLTSTTGTPPPAWRWPDLAGCDPLQEDGCSVWAARRRVGVADAASRRTDR